MDATFPIRSASLADLHGEIITVDHGQGFKQLGVLFDCPACGTHSQFQPFGETHEVRTRPDGYPMNVWKREAGSTIADLTLSPSFLVAPSVSCPVGVHGYIRAGRWEGC